MERALKLLITRRIIESSLALGLIVGIVFLWRHTAAARLQFFSAQRALQNVPQQVSQQTSLAVEIDKHRHDISRLRAYVVERQNIGEVIAAIEAAGHRHKLSVQIADVAEASPLSESSDELLSDVRLKLTAVGRPEAMLRFLHTVEHVPYLLYLESWQLDTGPDGSGSLGDQLVVPTVAPQSDGSQPSMVAADGHVQADIILTINHEKD